MSLVCILNTTENKALGFEGLYQKFEGEEASQYKSETFENLVMHMVRDFKYEDRDRVLADEIKHDITEHDGVNKFFEVFSYDKDGNMKKSVSSEGYRLGLAETVAPYIDQRQAFADVQLEDYSCIDLAVTLNSRVG
jgi:hypothetical protein